MMIYTNQRLYKETKQIMLGNKEMKAEFKPLADWIDKKYGVKTINIYYDTFDNEKRPRIWICFEMPEEARIFDKNKFSYDSKKQKAIGEEFKKMVKEQGLSKYKTNDILVVYDDFKSSAKSEALNNIPISKIEQLKTELNNKDIWEISRGFSFCSIIIFVYTEKQKKEYENSEEYQTWTDKFYELLLPYDEFGYFKRESFSIFLDSKENFDTDYDGKWFYYYR